MSYTLQVRFDVDITADQRLEEFRFIGTLFNDLYPRQKYERTGEDNEVSYVLEAHLEQFPVSPLQISYIERRNCTLINTPNVLCRVCGPVTGQLIAQTVKEEI